MKVLRVCVTLVCLAAACSGKSPTSPSSSSIAPPVPTSPDDGAAVATYRPTFVVRNSTSAPSGTRQYEFVVADDTAFTTASVKGVYAVYVHTTTVPEGSGGTTSYTPDVDLQPATTLYWRARVVQGGTASDWTPTRTFTTPVAAYSQPGALYDPLTTGSTIGVPQGATEFLPGQGLRLDDSNAYLRYQLAQPLDSGEFSMEVQGLYPEGPGAKLKVFSMMDGTGDLYRSSYLLDAQYRGVNGNPDNCITFKALLGDPFFKLEPDGGTRGASVRGLDPTHWYFWKGTWGNGFHLTVQDGIGGPTLYDYALTVADLGTTLTADYNPNPHYAYLGANNGPYGEEDGSWPRAVYRNVWIGRGPRPAALGSAIARK